MRRHGEPLPVRLFLSACPALHVRRQPAPSISHMSDEEFLDQIATRYGAPREVLATDEVRDTVLPALRADLLVAESYRYVHEAPLHVPISSFGATEDPEVSRAEVEAWRQQTTGDFRTRMFPGNHFFLAAERKRLHQALLEDLQAPQFP
jgi:medium-chain acyl-[acyl-carrier-protein] hydrolase